MNQASSTFIKSYPSTKSDLPKPIKLQVGASSKAPSSIRSGPICGSIMAFSWGSLVSWSTIVSFIFLLSTAPNSYIWRRHLELRYEILHLEKELGRHLVPKEALHLLLQLVDFKSVSSIFPRLSDGVFLVGILKT